MASILGDASEMAVDLELGDARSCAVDGDAIHRRSHLPPAHGAVSAALDLRHRGPRHVNTSLELLVQNSAAAGAAESAVLADMQADVRTRT